MTERIQSHGQPFKVRPRLLATFTALAMMGATAVPSLLSGRAQEAHADESAGSKCVEQNINIGTDLSNATIDTGVATYVGRDLYLGTRPADTSNFDGTNHPDGTYTVELEGLTLVNGKMAINGAATSWDKSGIRLGAVGFGAQFRPAVGSDALVVGGNDSAIEKIGGSATANVGAWERGVWLGAGSTDNQWYRAQIAGDEFSVWGRQNKPAVVDGYGESNAGQANVAWNVDNPLAHVRYADPSTGKLTETDYSNFKTTFSSDSKSLKDAKDTGFSDVYDYAYTASNSSTPGIYVGRGKSETIKREKYNASGGANEISMTFTDTSNERVITFNGDGTSTLQIFTIDGSYFNEANFPNDQKQGLSFAFNNIPSDASVAVNITGTDPISFHNGWRFYWNGTEIGGNYKNDTSLYNAAAKSVLWNYTDSSMVTIYGGKNTRSEDDPAAATIGSIWVPKGSLESHNSSNGRMWVGEDLILYTPKAQTTGVGTTSSAIWMDQERHNYPWRGSLRSECAVIGWNKVDTSNAPLGGTTFGIYATKTDAMNREHAISKVQDNNFGTGDLNATAGAFQVGNLAPNANYYIREISSDANHKLNENIYHIVVNAAQDGPYTTITTVYNEKGEVITQNTLLNNGAIVNEPIGTNVKWGKYADGDDNYTPLPGSEWDLFDSEGNKLATLKDNTTAVESITIMSGDETVSGQTIEVTDSLDLGLVILPEDANKTVIWSSNNEEYVTVNQHGHVEVLQPTEEGQSVRITVTSADGKKSDWVDIVAKTQSVNSLTVSPTALNLHIGETGQLTATVDPQEVAVTWTSDDSTVATVSATGKVTGIAAGNATVTARAGGKKVDVTVTVTVAPASSITVYAAWTNQNTINLNYKIGSAAWTTVQMDNSCDASYKKAVIPVTSDEKMLVYFDNGSGSYKNPVSKTQTDYKEQDGNNWNFKFQTTDGNIYRVENDGWVNISAPTCAASVHSAVALEVGQAVLSENESSSVPTVRAAKDADVLTSVENGTSPYRNIATEAGKFELENLPDGIYVLKESKAPEGYFLNPTEYKFEVKSPNVTWIVGNPAIVDGVAWIPDSPTEFGFAKLDGGYDSNNAVATGDPLAGSTWELEEFDATKKEYKHHSDVVDCVAESADKCTGADTDHRAGQFKLEKLGVGKYRLHETDAPAGYELDEDSYYYFVHDTAPTEGSTVTWTKATENHDDKGTPTETTTVQSVGNYVNFAYNFRTTGSVNWVKVEEGSTTKFLGGSEWKLERKDGDTWTAINPETITDCTDTCGTNGDQDKEVGYFEITKLQWGEYRLTETKAPDGYNLSDKTYTFTIDATHLTDIKIQVDGADLADGNLIENTPGVILPETGGTGVNMALVYLGVVLVGIAMMGCGIVLRKQA